MKRAFRSFSRREWVLGGACLVWLAWVFWRHSTLPSLGDLAFLGELRAGLSEAHGAQAFANLTAALPAWFWALGALVTMAALGKRLSGWLGAPPMNRALGLAQAFGLGMIALTTLWLGLGLNGLWERPVFVGSALGGLAWGVRSLTRRSPVRPPRMPFWAWGPALLAGLLLLLALAQSLVPEAYFDGLVYHLSVPQFWLDRHGILNDPTCFHSYYPFGAEIYFLNGFWSGDPAGAKLLNTASLVLAALAAGGWAAEAAGPAWGFLTGASLFFVPWVSTTVWTTQNEVVLGLFLLLGSYCAKRWAEADPAARRPWAWGMGLMGGAAWTVKYTALPVLVALGAALWLWDRRVFSRERWKDWALVAGLWAASLGPWLLKNWVYTGNPLYPYFSGLLGGLRLPADRYAELLGNHESAFGTGMPFWRWPLEAWRHLDPTLAPPLLGFLPFLLLGAVFWKKERFLLSLAALSLAGGFLVSFQTRLMVPEMFLFLTAAGCFIGRWRSADKTTGGLGAAVAPRAWAAVLSLFGLLTLLSVARLTVQYDQSQLIWLGAQSRDAYLRACPQTASYYSLARACGWLPEGDRLLIIGDARALYYPRPFLVNSVYDVPLWTRIGRSSPDPAAVGEALRRLGVDDLVFSGEERARMAGLYPADYALTPAQARVLDGFLEKRTQRVYQDGPRAIYRLKPPAAPRGKPGLSKGNP